MAAKKPMSEAGAIRSWATAQGFDIGVRGLIPSTLRQQWISAGCMWPTGERKPPGWSLDVSKPTRRQPGAKRDSHQRRTSTFPVRPPAVEREVGGFLQPVPPTREELGFDPVTLEVALAAGGTTTVLAEHEVVWFNSTRDAYLRENRIVEHTDLQDLDRLMMLELAGYRWGQWLSSNMNYDGQPLDTLDLGAKLKAHSDGIGKLKDQMGLSKRSRDASASSVSERWDRMLKQAGEFGVHRQNQVRQALTLMNQVSAVVNTFYRSDEEERRIEGFNTEAEIVAWLRDDIIPAYHAVDEHFKQNTQRLWVRDK